MGIYNFLKLVTLLAGGINSDSAIHPIQRTSKQTCYKVCVDLTLTVLCFSLMQNTYTEIVWKQSKQKTRWSAQVRQCSLTHTQLNRQTHRHRYYFSEPFCFSVSRDWMFSFSIFTVYCIVPLEHCTTAHL